MTGDDPHFAILPLRNRLRPPEGIKCGGRLFNKVLGCYCRCCCFYCCCFFCLFFVCLFCFVLCCVVLCCILFCFVLFCFVLFLFLFLFCFLKRRRRRSPGIPRNPASGSVFHATEKHTTYTSRQYDHRRDPVSRESSTSCSGLLTRLRHIGALRLTDETARANVSKDERQIRPIARLAYGQPL